MSRHFVLVSISDPFSLQFFVSVEAYLRPQVARLAKFRLPARKERQSLRRLPLRGRIKVRSGELCTIEPRSLLAGSSMRIWWDSHWKYGEDDCCWLDYRATRRTPGFLCLNYIRSGPSTTLRTLRACLRVLDAVAWQRGALAIFAHVGTSVISDRLLRRWGWEPHAEQLGGRQWVKRFYQGYPLVELNDLGPLAADYFPPTSHSILT